MTIHRIARSGLLSAALVLAGCAKGGEGAGAAAAARPKTKVATGAEAKGVDAWFPLTVGGKALRVQVAVLEAEQQRGLMGRKDLGPDDGMVFVYPAPQQMSFWMRNTPTPLDIGFFREDGTLGEVYPLYPYDETPVRSSGLDYTLALETNQGWFAKHGLKPGAKVDLGQLADALRARGFRPERYAVRVAGP
ncbi:MAG: DUF192 domain-containing protein [Opitutaceae bacterium]|jgi:hypothetical protein|nr:DUF192 domain-containing protein [Opitutaceae bacterium]